MKISKHFHDYEILSPKLIELCREKNIPTIWFIPEIVIDFLESLRDIFNKPVYVNHKNLNLRGICTNEENLDEDRTLLSQHNFSAIDVSIYAIDQEVLYNWVKSNAEAFLIGGFGMNWKEKFIHIDWRNAKEPIKWHY